MVPVLFDSLLCPISVNQEHCLPFLTQQSLRSIVFHSLRVTFLLPPYLRTTHQCIKSGLNSFLLIGKSKEANQEWKKKALHVKVRTIRGLLGALAPAWQNLLQWKVKRALSLKRERQGEYSVSPVRKPITSARRLHSASWLPLGFLPEPWSPAGAVWELP